MLQNLHPYDLTGSTASSSSYTSVSSSSASELDDDLGEGEVDVFEKAEVRGSISLLTLLVATIE